jgi:hypothetical protein
MGKIKLIYDFFRLWAYYRDRKEAWEDAKMINDKEFQKEIEEELKIWDVTLMDGLEDESPSFSEILDEVWRSYSDSHWIPPTNAEGPLLSDQLWGLVPMEHSRETFELEIRRNPEFAQKWGLEIVEMKISRREGVKHLHNMWKKSVQDDSSWEEYKQSLQDKDIPTKLIAISYNNQMFDFYE